MTKLAVFDLDGTLIDSVRGIAYSVNCTRALYNFAPLPLDVITGFIGDGARKLMERSLADVALPVPFEEALQKMVQCYEANPVYDTPLYAGVAEGLAQLKKSNWIVCAVSNKPQVVGQKVIRELGIEQYMDENIGGGGKFPLKPAPDALCFLMEKYHVAPENTVVVGDNHTDIFFAANAGAKSIFCTYGFGKKADSVSTFDAGDFAGVIDILQKNF